MIKKIRLEQGKYLQWSIHLGLLATSVQAVSLFKDRLTQFMLQQHFSFLNSHAWVAVLPHVLPFCT